MVKYGLLDENSLVDVNGLKITTEELVKKVER